MKRKKFESKKIKGTNEFLWLDGITWKSIDYYYVCTAWAERNFVLLKDVCRVKINCVKNNNNNGDNTRNKTIKIKTKPMESSMRHVKKFSKQFCCQKDFVSSSKHFEQERHKTTANDDKNEKKIVFLLNTQDFILCRCMATTTDEGLLFYFLYFNKNDSSGTSS